MSGLSEQDASSSTAEAGQQMSSSPCRLLSLAAELRNEIYQLVFTCNDAKIDLATAAPPSSALLRCCRQIHCEAKQIFKDSIHEYYTKGHFRLLFEHKGEGDDPYATLRKVAKTHDINSIRNIQFTFKERINDYFYTAVSQQNGLAWDLEQYASYERIASPHLLLLSEGDQSFRWIPLSNDELGQVEEVARNYGASVLRGRKGQIEALLAGMRPWV